MEAIRCTHLRDLVSISEIVYRALSKSLCWNKGMVSAKHEAEKQDFSNSDIDILDIVSNTSVAALINSPNLTANFAAILMAPREYAFFASSIERASIILL